MKTYKIRYQEQVSSPIYVGSGLSKHLHKLIASYEGAFYIVDANTVRLAQNYLGINKEDIYVLPSGEEFKTLAQVEMVYKYLLEHHVNRSSVLVALGGGVVTDLGGFVATTILRGIDFILVPTTLLGMIDAAIGGKTGVNLEHYKNQVGTIVQPAAVYADTDFLKTLPANQRLSGLGELVKYAIAQDANMFRWLEKSGTKLGNQEMVEYALRNVTKVVNADPKEQLGIRSVLNFGHTLGHGIESVTDFKVSHGEAVAEGIRFAVFASHVRGLLGESQLLRVNNLLLRLGFKPKRYAVNDELVDPILKDKKNASKGIRMVLISAIGKATTQDVSELDLRHLLYLFYSGK